MKRRKEVSRQLANVVIVNALQLEAVRRHASLSGLFWPNLIVLSLRSIFLAFRYKS